MTAGAEQGLGHLQGSEHVSLEIHLLWWWGRFRSEDPSVTGGRFLTGQAGPRVAPKVRKAPREAKSRATRSPWGLETDWLIGLGSPCPSITNEPVLGLSGIVEGQ